MSARITRSQSKNLASQMTNTLDHAILKKTSELSTLESTSFKKAFKKRVRELDAREAELDAREAALLKREIDLDTNKPTITNMGNKLYIINYLSDYQGIEAESEVFIGNDEKLVAREAFDWMVEQNKGLDLEMAFDELEDTSFKTLDKFIAHVRNNCKSFKSLKNICEQYNDSYFEDYDGWKLKFTEKRFM